jgi:hypothetical protein
MLNVLMLFFTFSSFSDKKRIFVPLAEAMSVFLCIYSLLSAILWVFEAFSVGFCLFVTTFLVAILFAFAYLKNSKKRMEFFALGGIKFDYRVLINRSVLIVATLISLGSYSTIGIGYNDGNAQTQAIAILSGQKSLEFEIEEYANIAPDSEYEDYFFDSINDIDKENFTATYRIVHDYTREDKQEVMLGKFGSNPVYPSLLALAGGLFGIQRMAYIQVLFAFCLFVFVNEILRTLKCDWKLRSVLVLLLSVSPIIVYCNHTTLVEPLLGFCMVMFTYFLLCKNDKFQILSSLGVITFAFLHSSVYTMIPLFLVLYWMYYIHTQQTRHLVSSGLIIVGYTLSFIFLNITAFENTLINYKLGIPFLGKYNYIFVIIIFTIALIVGVLLAIILKKADTNRILKFEKGIGCRIFKIIMATMAFAPIPIIVVLIIFKCYTFGNFLNITFIEFVVCSGVLLIPYVMYRLISTKYPMGIKEATVVVLFIYSVVIYSCVMKTMLEGYYYESRYISSFIPFVIIISGMMLQLLKGEEKYFIPIISSMILLVPYTVSLLDSRSEIRLDNEIFEDVMETVIEKSDEDTVIFVEKDLLKYFYYPLISITDERVYPIEKDYFDSFCADTDDYYSKVIYITNENGNSHASPGSVFYLKFNNRNYVSEDNLSVVLGLPNGFTKGDTEIIQIIKKDALHRFLNYDLYDDLKNQDIKLSVEDVEITEDENAVITVSITDGDKIYFNDTYLLSYHLEYEGEEDIYDCPRTNMGPLINGDFTLSLDLKNQPEEVTMVIDIVDEGVAWYSWKNEVPAIDFVKNEDGWEYNLYRKKIR